MQEKPLANSLHCGFTWNKQNLNRNKTESAMKNNLSKKTNKKILSKDI